MKISLTVKLIGDGKPFTMTSESAQVRPVDGARRWRCAFPTRDCPIDPRLMDVASVAVDDLDIGKADFVEESAGILVLAGAWPTAIAEILYA